MTHPEKKLFVPDTNVIMHKFNSIYDFQEHDVCILTTVLEELDKFKKGNETKNVNVREFHRILDKLRATTKSYTHGKGPNAIHKTVSALFHGGVSLGEGLGTIEIKPVSRKLDNKVKDLFYDEIPDHRILSAIFSIKAEELKGQKRRVILVTKDINLSIKAGALGIEVEDYQNDKIPHSISDLNTGKGEIVDESLSPLIELLYEAGKAPIFNAEYSACINKEIIKPNMYFALKCKSKSILVRVDVKMEYFHRIKKVTVSGITPKNSEQAFSVHALMQQDISLVALRGKAGTGKTLLAMATGVQQIKECLYERIIVSAAMVPLSNKDIGALPGDANEKVSPYMQGLYDNLAFIQSQMKGPKVQVVNEEDLHSAKARKTKKEPSTDRVDFISALKMEGKIKIQPLASIRGRSFNNTIFIIDEAQNLTPHEVKTIITRAGVNTKVVFCGDVMQIDSPYLDSRSNGLSHIVHRLSGQAIFAHVSLEKGERSELAEIAANLL